MSDVMIGIFLLVGLVLLLLSGLPVAFCMIALSVGAVWFLGSGMNMSSIAHGAFESQYSFVLIAVPLFIFMASTMAVTGFGNEIFEVVSKWFGHLPGGLAVAAVISCAGFGAISGTSLGTLMGVGVVSYPEMRKRNYAKGLTTGSLAAGGTLGILIPPSLCMILYGLITGTSVGKLFIAGIIPGVIMTVLFSLYIVIRATLQPSIAERTAPRPWKERLSSVHRLWVVMLLMIVVLGSIYTGAATPSEAAAVGSIGALILSIFPFRALNLVNLRRILKDTVLTSCMACGLILGAGAIGYIFVVTLIPQRLATLLAGLDMSPMFVLSLIYLAVILLGCVLESIAITMTVLPLLYYSVSALGFDLIWFGVAWVILQEIAVLTPPVGLNLFAMKGIATDASFAEVIRGSLPFVGLQVLTLIIITFFPNLALWLPSSMG